MKNRDRHFATNPQQLSNIRMVKEIPFFDPNRQIRIYWVPERTVPVEEIIFDDEFKPVGRRLIKDPRENASTTVATPFANGNINALDFEKDKENSISSVQEPTLDSLDKYFLLKLSAIRNPMHVFDSNAYEGVMGNAAFEIVFLFEQELEPADIFYDGFHIKRSRKLLEVLNGEEKTQVQRDEEGLRVRANVNPDFDEYELYLTSTSKGYTMLYRGWLRLTKDRNLETGDCVQVWGVRRDSGFSLVINAVKHRKKGLVRSLGLIGN